ncbi:hypothetical protein QBC41DRAFT_48418 [Cercophora samala]|uniref:Uncharacterized protein n=1 Tax=Cercophora samala TaxID=330535 RepID=A0AA39ZIE0_9PEZI|nr:hypothetical protein QBC41DRAFT_48418 [Cercophora samala]
MSANIPPTNPHLLTPARRLALQTSYPELLAAIDEGCLHIVGLHHFCTPPMWVCKHPNTPALCLGGAQGYHSRDFFEMAGLQLVAGPGYVLHPTLAPSFARFQPARPSTSIATVVHKTIAVRDDKVQVMLVTASAPRNSDTTVTYCLLTRVEIMKLREKAKL